jgi:methionyl-tRNA formyltransferase
VRIGRAWTTVGGRRLLVHSAAVSPGDIPGPPGRLEGTVVATGEGGLRLLSVQPEGRTPLDAGEWLRGARLPPGTQLGDEDSGGDEDPGGDEGAGHGDPAARAGQRSAQAPDARS